MTRILVALLSLPLFLSALFASPEESIAQALEGPLKGYRYNKRLATPGEADHLLVFAKDGTPDVRFVAWTESNSSEDRFAAAPVSPMDFTIYAADGTVIETIQQKGYMLIMKLEKEPRIYAPAEPNDYMRVAATAESVQSPRMILGPQTVELQCTYYNPLGQDLLLTSDDLATKAVLKPGGRYTLKKEVEFGRPNKPMVVPIEALGIVQQITLIPENPLSLEVWPQMDRSITLTISNPSGSPFNGEGQIQLVTGEAQGPKPFTFPVAMAQKKDVQSLQIPLNFDGMLPFPIQVKILQRSRTELGKEFVLTQTPPLQFLQLPAFEKEENSMMPQAYEGRTQGAAHWAMSAEIPREGAPVESRGALVLVYTLKEGAISIKVRPKSAFDRALPSTPTGYGLWVYGDNSNNFVTCGIRDASGKVFQPDPVKLDWKGWRYLSFRWPTNMREPLEWDSILELVNGNGEANGAVFINNPSLLFEIPEYEVEPPPVEKPEEPEIVDRRNEVPSAIPIYNMPQGQGRP